MCTVGQLSVEVGCTASLCPWCLLLPWAPAAPTVMYTGPHSEFLVILCWLCKWQSVLHHEKDFAGKTIRASP